MTTWRDRIFAMLLSLAVVACSSTDQAVDVTVSDPPTLPATSVAIPTVPTTTTTTIVPTTTIDVSTGSDGVLSLNEFDDSIAAAGLAGYIEFGEAKALADQLCDELVLSAPTGPVAYYSAIDMRVQSPEPTIPEIRLLQTRLGLTTGDTDVLAISTLIDELIRRTCSDLVALDATPLAQQIPPTTLSADPMLAGLQVSQQLATALAEGHWDAARRINPSPVWNDEKYEESFVGLEAATIILGELVSSADQIEYWLGQISHELRDTGPQTTFSCVHWRYFVDGNTIERIADEQVRTDDEHIDPSSYEPEVKLECPSFDGGNPEDELPEERASPPPPATPTPPTCPTGGLVVEITGVSSSQPFTTFSWVIDAELLVTNTSTAKIEVLAPSPKIIDLTQDVNPQVGGVGPWRSNGTLEPGQSVQTRTSTFARSPAGNIVLASSGDWHWPEFPNC